MAPVSAETTPGAGAEMAPVSTAGACVEGVMVMDPTTQQASRRRGMAPQRTASRVCCGILLVVILLVTALLIATSWVVVNVHQAALVYDSLHKKLAADVLQPGRYFLGVAAVPLVYDTRVSTVEFITLCASGNETGNATGGDTTGNTTQGGASAFVATATAAANVSQRSRCSESSWSSESSVCCRSCCCGRHARPWRADACLYAAHGCRMMACAGSGARGVLDKVAVLSCDCTRLVSCICSTIQCPNADSVRFWIDSHNMQLRCKKFAPQCQW